MLGSALAALLVQPLAAAQTAASPTQASGSYLRAEDFRVATVAYRLAVAGKAHCPSLLPQSGLFLHYLPEYEGPNRAEAARLYGLERGPGVLSVVADSPAAHAGVRAGDVLLAVNGQSLPGGSTIGGAKKWRKAVEPIEDLLEEKLRLGAARFTLLREGRELDLEVGSVAGCPIRSRLARSNQANAFSDGRTAIMTTRLLEFMRNDDELAVAIAHEGAHNILRHPAQLDAENVPKGFLANFGKNAKRVRQTEVEADRLGLKLLWSAGYDVSAVIPFWRRLYRTFDPLPTPKLFNRHPSLGARERIVEETLAELRASAARPKP